MHIASEIVKLIMEYSAVMDNKAVNAPGPAYIGKASGTNEPSPLSSVD